MTDIVVSTSAYLAFNIVAMQDLDRNLGVEALIENANDHVWRRAFEVLLKDRPSQFTIHGPFLFMDLSHKDCKFDEVIENYKWTFDYAKKYDAKHVVLHPHGYIDNFRDETRESRKGRCIERVSRLAELGHEFGANLLVENLCYPEILFEQEEYVALFQQIPYIKSLIDVGHSLIKKWDVPKLLQDLGDTIDAFHIDDNDGVTDQHVRLGDGVLDYKEFFDAYKKYCGRARLVLEYLGVPTAGIEASAEWIRGLAE
jgi:sugar phosphate isomerase/epimerase